MLKSFQRGLMGLGGVFHCLPREFVTGQVIFFAVVYGSDAVCVRCEAVKFRSSLMRIRWHKCLSELLN